MNVPDDINPGIRKTVEQLQSWGFQTVDSGDGATHDHSCDRAYPYASCIIPDPNDLAREADRLKRLLATSGITFTPISVDGPEVEASYAPGGPALIDLRYVDDSMLVSE